MNKNIKHSKLYRNIFKLFILTIFLSGCGAHSAINRTENYSHAWPVITYSSEKTILVSVVDKRPYIQDGSVKPSFVGLMRGGYGNPWRMHTESGNSLAEDLSSAIASGYNNSGNTAILSTSDFNYKNVKNDFIKLVLTLTEWKSDTYMTSQFIFDMKVVIYDSDEKILGEASMNNRDKEKATSAPVDSARRVLTEILNNDAIIHAIQ